MMIARYALALAILAAAPLGCTCGEKKPPSADAKGDTTHEPTPLERERYRLGVLERAFEKAQQDLEDMKKRGEPTEIHEKKIEAVWESIVKSREKISTLEKREREKQ